MLSYKLSLIIGKTPESPRATGRDFFSPAFVVVQQPAAQRVVILFDGILVLQTLNKRPHKNTSILSRRRAPVVFLLWP